MPTKSICVRLGSYALDFLTNQATKRGYTKSDIIRLCVFYSIANADDFDEYTHRIKTIRGIFSDEGETCDN